MALLIDGFNLIYKFPDLEHLMYINKLNKARTGLIEKLKKYHAGRKEKIIVSFDGKRNPGDNTEREEIEGIDIYYSLHLSADFILKEFIKQSVSPRTITLITSDKEIRFFANPFRVKSITSEDFASQLLKRLQEQQHKILPEKEIDPKIPPEEVSFWERMLSRKK